MKDQNKAHDSYSFLADIKKELDAERDADYSVTPERAAYLRKFYPRDTPAGYEKIKPEEFFDGSL
jgi:hypothetical protein